MSEPGGDLAELGGYKLIGLLAAGGMGEVYIAKAPDGALVVVKTIRADLAEDADCRRRFSNEVDAVRRVGGGSTAAVLGSDTEAQRPWLATEYIVGVSLAEAVAARQRLPAASVRWLALGLIAGLEAIHAEGLTHRDLTPSNVLLARSGPRIIDFGIVRSDAEEPVTRVGEQLGTPGFMAPEQFLTTGKLGSYTDVFTLGATLVFAATGSGPFDLASNRQPEQLMYQAMYQEPNLDKVPEELRGPLAQCLAKDPRNRPSLEELRLTLSAFPVAPLPTAWSRRKILRGTAAVLGAAGLAGAGTWVGLRLAAADPPDPKPGAGRPPPSGNPLHVADRGRVKLLLFGDYGGDGGKDGDYFDDVLNRFREQFPHVRVETEFTKLLNGRGVTDLVDPGLRGPDLPDLISNISLNSLDIPRLAAGGDLKDLTELLDAPSADDPDRTVRQMLLPGVADESRQVEGDALHGLYYNVIVQGLWYSRKALAGLGVSYPRTFAELLATCGKAASRGMAGWTYPGKYANYLWYAMAPSIAKRGGREVLAAIVDNEPDAWSHPAVHEVFAAYHQLARKGYVLRGSESMDHLQSQRAWAEGRALFVPNGSWLENETRKVVPPGFDMAVGAPPSIGRNDRLPFGTMSINFSDMYVVPNRAGNPEAAMEILRIMFGRVAAARFAVRSKGLVSVRGIRAWKGLSPTTESARRLYAEAGRNAVIWNDINSPTLKEACAQALRELMSDRIDPDRAVQRIQQAADRV
jgi:N-acetylglucosamine transport system substrate-binding protein